MKIALVILVVLMCSPLAISEEKTLRYKDFVFRPNYSSSADGLKKVLERELSEFHYVQKIYTAASHSNSLALYRVNVKKERRSDYKKKLDYKQYVLKQEFDETDWPSWDAVSFINQDGQKSLLLKSTKYNEYFPGPGRRDYDHYGCIDSRPVYTASLIAGQPDFFFVIMATEGNPMDLIVRDHMELALVSNQGEKQFVEKIFWANYRPSSGKKVHFYGQSVPDPKFERMPIEDGHGRKRYAKMYIADLDQDNRLDILFWFRTYRSTAFTEERGFRFEKEFFTLYRENAAYTGFEKTAIDNSSALALLTKNQLTWEQGYPQDNSLCEGRSKNAPLMMNIVD